MSAYYWFRFLHPKPFFFSLTVEYIFLNAAERERFRFCQRSQESLISSISPLSKKQMEIHRKKKIKLIQNFLIEKMIFRRLWKSSSDMNKVFSNAKEILSESQYKKFQWVTQFHYPIRYQWERFYRFCGNMLFTTQQQIFSLFRQL